MNEHRTVRSKYLCVRVRSCSEKKLFGLFVFVRVRKKNCSVVRCSYEHGPNRTEHEHLRTRSVR